MLKYNKSMKIGFNSLKNKLIGVKININQKYWEIKPIIKGKLDKYHKFTIKVFNNLGLARLMIVYRYLKKITPKLTKSIFLILLSGGAIYVTVTSIFIPIHFLHQIFGYGLGLYIGSKLITKTWNSYVSGKIQINQGVQEIKEVENDMG